MINFNGTLLQEKNGNISLQNRAFKFGDGIFETIKVTNKKVIFWEDHYFRLMASMRMLRMKIPMAFTLEFLQDEILKTIEKQEESITYRVRLSIFRKDGGLYLPESNDIDYLIDVKPIIPIVKEVYKIDLYKDFYNYSGFLSTVKTTNRMLNVIASVFAQENDLDNCILLNERKGVVEATNANIFILKGNAVFTPALTEGCIKGIIRKKVIEQLQKSKIYTIEETSISPFEIQKADEVFITNAIVGIQPVTNYRKKEFKTDISKKFIKTLQTISTLN